MSKLAALVRLAYENAYDLKPPKKQYSKPKVFDWGGDLTKRWYVYFSFRNPATGKMERQPTIDAGANQYKDLRSRKQAFRNLRDATESILEQGLYNPFTDGTDNPTEKARLLNVSQAAEFVLTIKKNTLEDTTYRTYRGRIRRFEKYLLENGYRDRLISSVPDTVVLDFLNNILRGTSPANFNNVRADISSFFSLLVDNKVLAANPVKAIKKMDSNPTRHKSFTPEQEEAIMDKILATNPVLGLYIMVVSICVVRCIEANRLLIEDIDVVNRRITFKAKNQKVKTKIIPKLLWDALPDLSRYDRKAHLFGYNYIGQKMEGTATTRQLRYGRLFKQFKKEFNEDHNNPYKLGPEYTLYSFRHTNILKIYRSLRAEGKSPFVAKSELMLITGHSTMKALEAYLRGVDAELPEDYSHHLK